MTAEPRNSQRLALFPLNLVLFPGGLLSLRIFEPRYFRMVSECMREEQPFVAAAIVDGPESGGVATTATVGGLARITDFEQGEEGLLYLVCEGEGRVALSGIEVEKDRLLRVDASALPFPPSGAVPEDLSWMTNVLAELLQRLGPPFDRLRDVPADAAQVANRLTELLPLPLTEKQALFEIDDSVERLRRLAGLINPRGEGVSVV